MTSHAELPVNWFLVFLALFTSNVEVDKFIFFPSFFCMIVWGFTVYTSNMIDRIFLLSFGYRRGPMQGCFAGGCLD